MKIVLPLLALLLFARPFRPRAAEQGGDPAVAQALQQDTEERLRRVTADIQNLQDTQEVLQKHLEEIRQRMSKLEDELHTIKDEQGRNSGNYVTRDDLRKAFEKFAKEVDDRREADKKVILESIRGLEKSAPSMVSDSPKGNSSRHAPEPSDEDTKIYVVKRNDRLKDIIARANELYAQQGLPKITEEEVRKANPNLTNPNLLRTGQKIRIPIHGKLKENP
jgi:chromosome segregation ATPase